MKRHVDRVHFVGVGGIGMSGLAEILVASGYSVSGSDLSDSPICERLRGLGVRVEIGHAAEHVRDADVVVYSSAIRATNPELQAAERAHVPVIARAEMLGELMRMKYGVAVSGSHGKTTTTSLAGAVLEAAGLDPTIVVGGIVKSLGTNSQLGSGDILIAEADESDGSFLRLMPSIVVITNIDREHLDHYQSFENLRAAFLDFANRVPFWGCAVLCLDDPHVQEILPDVTRRVRSYGLSRHADVMAHDVRGRGFETRFHVTTGGEDRGEIRLRMPGRHNVANALAAISVGLEFDVPFERIREGLEEFAGIERRFELRGEHDGVSVFDDYSHHPAEVVVALESARQVAAERPGARVVVAFQPHRYTRTRDCFDDLARAFHGADVLLLTDIYAAGESKIPGVDAARLAQAARDSGHRDVRHVAEREEIVPTLRGIANEGDLLIFMGAGDIGRLAGVYLDGVDGGEAD
ncbi:MAG: UDP-N-acetylmuramate--L-alanine ligase [Deltaproteobacteria bacterium]|nr:UDP-N-acetylmuramate--L-alanine ligase [Deltaproteobacteria bacterium]MBW2416004.1 UDP-N-acetylmuramate--L-alanine ligase [Deltaproteobacteria bacterium]